METRGKQVVSGEERYTCSQVRSGGNSKQKVAWGREEQPKGLSRGVDVTQDPTRASKGRNHVVRTGCKGGGVRARRGCD